MLISVQLFSMAPANVCSPPPTPHLRRFSLFAPSSPSSSFRSNTHTQLKANRPSSGRVSELQRDAGFSSRRQG